MIDDIRVIGRQHGMRGLASLFLSLLLVSCGVWGPTARRTKGTNVPEVSRSEFLDKYSERTLPLTIEGRGGISVEAKGKKVSTGIRTVLVSNQSFELSARPFGFVEIGRLTVDAGEGILVLDRMNKRAFREEQVAYWLPKAEKMWGINPSVLKSMVQNEPFDMKNSGFAVLRSMKMRYEQGRYHFYTSRNGVSIDHYLTALGDLEESVVQLSDRATIRIQYSDFTILTSDVHYRCYPQQMAATVVLPSRSERYAVEISWDRLSGDDEPHPVSRLEIPRGYQQIGVEDILDIVKKL